MKSAPDNLPPPPAWAFLPAEPQPVRIVRRLCVLFAVLAFAIEGMRLWGNIGVGATAQISLQSGRVLLAALVMIVCALPLRHPAIYVARWLAPIAYFALLPTWRWFALPVYLILWIPYLRMMAQFGVNAWFRPAAAIDRAWAQIKTS